MISATDNWKQRFHPEPDEGWLNDPNGLCFYKGLYHVFFQYSPSDCFGGGERGWGHFAGESLFDLRFCGMPVRPDSEQDRDGCWSGSAVVFNDTLYVFYTGNVDDNGIRSSNQILTTSTDGFVFGAKKTILSAPDYPSDITFDVRDPKVWYDGIWHMVLGARDKDDHGKVLYYEADDPYEWHFVREYYRPGYGYMWECPDMISIGGHKFLMTCPQGLAHERYRFQNIYSCGYFRLLGEEPGDLEELDHGFDLYAPQTFTSPEGDVILIGWMGMSDNPFDNPTTGFGRQNCLTIPRRLSVDEDGYILQEPFTEEENIIEFTDISDSFTILISDARLSFSEGEFILDLTRNDVGRGRDIRRAKVDKVLSLKIVCDSSSLEIFINDGRIVMTSRFYPDSSNVNISCNGIRRR